MTTPLGYSYLPPEADDKSHSHENAGALIFFAGEYFCEDRSSFQSQSHRLLSSLSPYFSYNPLRRIYMIRQNPKIVK
jgi:hypothetical protein